MDFYSVSFIVLLLVCALLYIAGINIMYSAFLVGYVLKAVVGYNDESKAKMDALGNFAFSFFIPIYFALVGIQLNVINGFSFFRFAIFFVIAFGLEAVGTLLMLIFTNQDDPFDIPAEYLELSSDPEKEVTINTNYLKRIVKKAASLEESGVIEYSISNLSVLEGASVTAKTNIFKLSLSQLYTSFAVTEYDVADIDKKLRSGEKVYAGVTINALGGRKVVAEIQEIIQGNYSSGIAYYSVRAKIIFGVEKTLDLTVESNLRSSAAQVAKNKGKTELKYASFEYYDPYLTPEKVESLGINITDIVERAEVLTNYSVTIKVQKTAVIDKLVIPTKCIFYDDSKTPYVLVKRDNKEVRVYIKVLLSTGSEAAVEVKDDKDEGKLSDGDKIIYQADSSLISSILG